jgi:DNA polymerase elongation subunit (family B)
MLKGWLFDIYGVDGGMVLWMIGAGGERIRLFDPYRPAFFVGGTKQVLRRAREAFRRSRTPVSLSMTERLDFWSGNPVSVMRVKAAGAAFNAAVRLVARVDGAELYNCDIMPEQMYLYEKGLFPLAFCEVETRGKGGPEAGDGNEGDGLIASIRVLEQASDIDYSLPPLEVLKLSVDADGANPNYGGERRALKASIDGMEYLLEWEYLLETLESMLVRYDPDVILTEWGDTFIIPHLREMARRRGRPLSLNRVPGRDIATRAGVTYFSYGRIVYRAPARMLFGRWHIDEKNSFIVSQTGLEGLFELARLTKIPIQRLARTSPGTGISSMQLDEAMRSGILIPWRKRVPEDFKTGLDLLTTDKGGLVYLPKPGVYDNVMEIDFASMYPAIMVNHNISPETLGCSCCDGEPVPGIGHRVCRKRRGLIPRVLEPILEKRRAYKELSLCAEDAGLRAIYKRRQTALKWMLVTCFGYLGYKNARFGRIEAHEAVTALGREKLLKAKEIAEERGFELLHAIVDSLWLRKPGMTGPECEELMREITRATGIPIALEGNYRWIAYAPSRTTPAIAVSNKYFGLFDTGEFKVRGLEVRRSDAPPIVKKMQYEMLDALRSAMDAAGFRRKEAEILEILRRYLLKVGSGDVDPIDLVITQRLSKDPADYRTNTAMAAASKMLLASGARPQAGEKVQMIIVDSSATGQIVKAIPYTPCTETLDVYDIAKYSELLTRAAESVLLRSLNEEERRIAKPAPVAAPRKVAVYSRQRQLFCNCSD